MKDNTLIKKLLDTLTAPIPLVWRIGGDGSQIRLYTDLENKTELFDFSVYENPETQPTYIYLKKNAQNVFSGKDPDMQPKMVSFVSEDDDIITILVEFSCSEELRKAGVDDTFILNSNLANPRFGVSTHSEGSKPRYFLVGYTQDEEMNPYVTFYHDANHATTMTLRFNN